MTGSEFILVAFAVMTAAILFVIAATWTVLLKHSTVGPLILFRWDVWLPSRAGRYLTPEGERRYRKLIRLSCLLYLVMILTIAGATLLVFAKAA